MSNTLSLSSSTSPWTLREGVSASGVSGLREEDLTRAIRHHRRAISSLEGPMYDDLSSTTTSVLLKRLKEDLSVLEHETERRNLSVASMAA